MKRILAIILAASAASAGLALAQQTPAPQLAAARGQTVYFNAWGGDQRINDYIAWAVAEVASRFGVKLRPWTESAKETVARCLDQ